MEDKRSSILSAAMRLIEQSGSQFTIDQAAREAGVAKGTVYLYFSSKEDLILQVIINALEQLEQGLQDAITGHRNRKTQLEEMLTAHYNLVIGKTQMLHKLMMAGDPQNLRQMADDLIPRLEAVEKLYINVLEQGIEEGSFRKCDPHTVAAILLTMVQNVAAATLFRPRLSRQGALRHMLAIIFQGLEINSGDLAFKNLLQEGSEPCKA